MFVEYGGGKRRKAEGRKTKRHYLNMHVECKPYSHFRNVKIHENVHFRIKKIW